MLLFIVGTSNWSGDYFISTGGLSCTISDTAQAQSGSSSAPSVQQQLKLVFERDWNSPYTVTVSDILNSHYN